jgi:hypothetical protein
MRSRRPEKRGHRRKDAGGETGETRMPAHSRSHGRAP